MQPPHQEECAVHQSPGVSSIKLICTNSIIAVLLLASGALSQMVRSPLAVDSTKSKAISVDSEKNKPFVFPSILIQSPLQTARLASPVYAKAMFFQPSILSRTMGPIDLMAAWKLERARQDELQTWNIILGTAVLGGAAWCGYEHIRKYGLW
jgi:hypothetical protein